MEGENALTQMLRSISSKRRNGVLEISTGEIGYEISFQSGKIVRALRRDRPVAQDVCRRLMDSGHPLEAVLEKLRVVDFTLGELCDYLEREGHVPRSEILLAKLSYEYDTLHSLADLGAALMDFKQRMVTVEPDLALGVSPGQLLLDLVELKSEGEQFRRHFGDLAASRLTSHGTLPRSASSGELRVWTVAQGGISFSDLARRALLSEYDLRRALSSLEAQGLLTVEKTAPTAAGSPLQPGKISLANGNFFDSLIDSALSLLEEPDGGDSLVLLEEPALEPDYVIRPTGSVEVEETEKSIGSTQSLFRITEATGVAPSVPLVCTVPVPEPAVDEVTDPPATAETLEEVAEVSEHAARSGGLSLLQLNYRFLEDDVAAKIATSVTVIFLVLLALLLPDSLRSWFDALAQISSK